MSRIFVGFLVTVYSFLSFAGGNLVIDTEQVYREVQDPKVFNANTCEQYIQSRADFIRARDYDFYVPKTEDEKAQFAVAAKMLTQKVFALRLMLKDKLTQFFNAQALSPECTMAIRQAMRVARTTEEMLLLYQANNNLVELPKVSKENGTLKGDYPQTFKNPKFYSANEEVELKSGDIIMMRGTAVVSALIAKIGDEDGMFSHLGVFYIEPKTGKKYILESLIESGMVVTSYDEWMKTVEARITVFRYPNETVAANAAQRLYDHYLNYKKQHGKTIPYDFAMDSEDHSKMFCSEVAGFAYELATNNRISLPTFQTPMNKIKDANFVQMMGIKSFYIFSPNDMDIEPRFEIVAEFRKIKKLQELRQQDLSMQAMFDWMQNYGYRLNVSAGTKAKLKLAKMVDKLGIKDLKIPNMPKKTLGVMVVLRAFQNNVIAPRVIQFEKEFIARTGQLPAHKDILEDLEKFRIEDCEVYHGKGEAQFHDYFHSKTLTSCK